VRFALVILVGLAACKGDRSAPEKPVKPKRVQAEPDPFSDARTKMVDQTIANRGVSDPRVLSAMLHVPRHELVPPDMRAHAYEDRPLPIGFGLTISQPYIVATMTEAAHIKPDDKVLEIGTGSGYQAAVLAELGAKVYSIEIHEELAKRTKAVLSKIGYGEIELRTGDGSGGWPEAAPFDAIIVTCAAPFMPYALYDELKPGGRMVVPIGDEDQELEVITKTPDGPKVDALFAVRFGPMLGGIRDPM